MTQPTEAHDPVPGQKHQQVAQTSDEKPRVRVLLVGEILYHYRLDVFKILDADPRLDMVFAAGSSNRDGTIASAEADLFNRVVPIRNRFLGPILWQTGLLSTVRRLRPDVTVFLGDAHYASTWVSAAYARLARGKVVFWTIGWLKPDSGLKRLTRLAFYNLANGLMLYGNVGLRAGLASGFPPSKMRVIYNSSPRGSVTSPDPDLVQQLDRIRNPIVTAISRLTEYKRLDMLMDLAAAMRTAGTPITVVIVGGGPEKERLRRLAKEKKIEAFMPGPLYSESDIAAVYERSTVTVIPGAAGLTTLQSFRYGVPVVTHDNDSEQGPETEAIVPGVTGSRFRQYDLEHLVQCVTDWVHQDAESRGNTANACRQIVEITWSPEAQAARIIESIQAFGLGETRLPLTVQPVEIKQAEEKTGSLG